MAHLKCSRMLALTIVIAVGVSAATSTSSGQPQVVRAQARDTCRYVKAVGIPSWIVEGVWDRGILVLADVKNRQLTQVSRNGVSLAKRDQTALVEYLKDFGPVGIRKGTMTSSDPSQVFVELANSELVPLDRNFSPRPRIALAMDSLSSGPFRTNQSYLFDWVLVQGEIVGYGDIEGEGPKTLRSRWRNGFVRYNINDPARVRMARVKPHGEGAKAAFRLTYPFLAGIGGTAYSIVLDGVEAMRLWRFGRADKDLAPMKAFPRHLSGKPAPPIWNFAEPEEFPVLMRDVEKFEMPAGLYAWDGSLFILSRSYERGLRHWYLSKIDPVRDELLWTVAIPGSAAAHHMTVIPGQDEWAFLEKGPVTAYMTQATHHIRFIKSEQMRARDLTSLCK